jgi:type II secretory pathway component PulK
MKRNQSSSSDTANTRRRGTILILFMLSLLLMSLTVGVLIRSTVIQRSLVRSDLQRVQADWLVHSAAARAASQLQANADYSGEQWSIPAEALNQHDSALASIQVATDPESETRRLVTITVNYPPEGAHRARATRVIPVTVPAAGSN